MSMGGEAVGIYVNVTANVIALVMLGKIMFDGMGVCVRLDEIIQLLTEVRHAVDPEAQEPVRMNHDHDEGRS
jgi:hypothetical protein